MSIANLIRGVGKLFLVTSLMTFLSIVETILFHLCLSYICFRNEDGYGRGGGRGDLKKFH